MKLRTRIKNAYNSFIGKDNGLAPFHSDELGVSGRDSVLEPYRRQYGKDIPIRPDEVTKLAGRRVDYKTMVGQTVSQVVNELVSSSAEVKGVVNNYIDFVVQDYILDSDDEAAILIIEEFIKGMGGKSKFISLLKQVAYGYYVEGAVCIELVGDPTTSEPKSIKYVSPWSMAAQLVDDGPEGEYYRYGQLNRTTRELDPVLYDEYNDEVNDDYFKYVPADQQGNNPFGTSQIAASMFPGVALTNLVTLIVQFIQGRVFPSHIYFPDYQQMQANQREMKKEDFDKAKKIVTQLLKGQLQVKDINQEVFSSVPIVAMLVGTLERSNIDGVELMADIFERQIQRASRVPRTLFGSRRAGSGLNDNESRVEWGGWAIVINSAQTTIQLPISEFFKTILETRGNQSEVNLKLLNEDVEIKRIHSEAADLKASAFIKIQQLGLYTREFLFRKFNDTSITSFDFADADENTDFLEEEPQSEPLPAPPAEE